MFHAKITADPDAGQLLPLAELLGAFSYALEITEGQPPGHCVRACWIGSHVGRALGLAGDAKSPYTGGHSSRVADLTRDLGTALGHTPERRRWLHRGALLHDIGKLGVPNTILDKPGSTIRASSPRATSTTRSPPNARTAPPCLPTKRSPSCAATSAPRSTPAASRHWRRWRSRDGLPYPGTRYPVRARGP